MKTKKNTRTNKFSLEKFQVAKLNNLNSISGGLADNEPRTTDPITTSKLDFASDYNTVNNNTNVVAVAVSVSLPIRTRVTTVPHTK